MTRHPHPRSPGNLPLPADLAGALCGLAAGWIAAGDAGLLGHPLRHALTWLALSGVVVVLVRHVRRNMAALAIGGIVTALLMTTTSNVLVNICAVVIALVAISGAVRQRTPMTLLAAEALAVLAIFQFARTSIPFVWQAADAVGSLAGRFAGALTGRPLWAGAGFGGIDLLVVSSYVAVMAPYRLSSAPQRTPRQAMYGMVAVIAGHMGYLGLMSFAPALSRALTPPLASTRAVLPDAPAATSLAEMLSPWIPWNLPLVGFAIHVGIVGAICYFAARSANKAPHATAEPRLEQSWRRSRLVVAGAGALLATLLVLVVAPSWKTPDLRGKKIVLYEKGFLNWLKPSHGEYGRYSIGMYGMLPIFLESLGADPLISAELPEKDLENADVLVMFYPNEPWNDGQLDRIWKFVRDGGSLLVVGEHTVQHEDGVSRFNQVLEPTRMRVRFDSAMFAVGGWLQSYESLWRPATAGLRDNENDFGVVIGASVRARAPARPLLVGRWGWADPGDLDSPAAMMGNGRYDAGERLGDVVLAAEQSFGKGKIVAFGDTSSFSNGINMGCHNFTARLFAYLADRDARPLAAWREAVGILAAGLLVVLLAAQADRWMVSSVAASLVIVSIACTAQTYGAWNLTPNGRLTPENKLAYVDGCHLGDFSRESWREDGLMGLCLTLMRNGYLTLMLPELTDQRLDGAQLLVSVAPARAYTPRERAAILRFIERGGIFLLTVGADRSGPSQSLLDDLGFRVGSLKWDGGLRDGVAMPLGHFKSPYCKSGDYLAHVRFHAAWPIECLAPNAEVITYYPPDKPLIVSRPVGRGRAVVIGDSRFAQNRNLEHESGEPFEGMRENADFWRWLVAKLANEEPWYPGPTNGPSVRGGSFDALWLNTPLPRGAARAGGGPSQ